MIVYSGNCPSGTVGTYCDSDCATLLACRKNIKKPVERLPCPDDAPYCNPGTKSCSSTPDLKSQQCISKTGASKFVCTDIGYFPDPFNCSIYHYCDETGAAFDITCPSEYIYDSLTQRCKRLERRRDCVTIDCSRQRRFPSYLTYSNQPSFYVLCYKVGTEIKTILQKCPDITNYEFDLSTMSCEFKCVSSNNFPDPHDCKKYFECYKDTKDKFRYVSRHVTCPTGTYFNADGSKCVKGSCTPEPTTNAPTTTPITTKTTVPQCITQTTPSPTTTTTTNIPTTTTVSTSVQPTSTSITLTTTSAPTTVIPTTISTSTTDASTATSASTTETPIPITEFTPNGPITTTISTSISTFMPPDTNDPSQSTDQSATTSDSTTVQTITTSAATQSTTDEVNTLSTRIRTTTAGL